MEEDYELKYLKYKLKYLTLKNNQNGGLFLPQTFSRQVNYNRAAVANLLKKPASNSKLYEMQSNKPSNNLSYIEGKCASQQYNDEKIKNDCSVLTLNNTMIEALQPKNNTTCSIDASRKANICMVAYANKKTEPKLFNQNGGVTEDEFKTLIKQLESSERRRNSSEQLYTDVLEPEPVNLYEDELEKAALEKQLRELGLSQSPPLSPSLKETLSPEKYAQMQELFNKAKLNKPRRLRHSKPVSYKAEITEAEAAALDKQLAELYG